ncbi:MAG: hypothetical protein FJ096_10980 [Deltaproteobacteria bacterium]|nr:hypothetical protein [Deltaproteobacteria bacterium]
MRSLAVVTLALALTGCPDKAGSPAGATSASATVSPSTAPPRGSAEPQPKPEKLDVDALKAALKCTGKASGPCAVLEEWKDCQPFNPVTQSGEGRWMGKGYLVKNGAFIDEYTLLRSKAVPAAQVAPGSLPAKIAIDSIPDERGGEKTNAEKAINAYERGDVPLPTNTAVTYVKERSEWSEAPVQAADGNQLYVATGSRAYLCKGTKQRVLLIRRSTTRNHPGDGVYAVLWPVSW